MGLFSTFSFHGSKTITTGEGGMFLTNSKKLYENVVTLNNHGRIKNKKNNSGLILLVLNIECQI